MTVPSGTHRPIANEIMLDGDNVLPLRPAGDRSGSLLTVRPGRRSARPSCHRLWWAATIYSFEFFERHVRSSDALGIFQRGERDELDEIRQQLEVFLAT